VAGQWGWEQQREGANGEDAGPLAAIGSWLVLGAAILLPILLPLVFLWLALPALWADGRLVAENVARGGVGALLAYLVVLGQWLLVAAPAVAAQNWPWILIGALGLLVVWVIRRG
jgi:uncharacterized BrkB/YihY/UPF0761 family membrane protein